MINMQSFQSCLKWRRRTLFEASHTGDWILCPIASFRSVVSFVWICCLHLCSCCFPLWGCLKLSCPLKMYFVQHVRVKKTQKKHSNWEWKILFLNDPVIITREFWNNILILSFYSISWTKHLRRLISLKNKHLKAFFFVAPLPHPPSPTHTYSFSFHFMLVHFNGGGEGGPTITLNRITCVFRRR